MFVLTVICLVVVSYGPLFTLYKPFWRAYTALFWLIWQNGWLCEPIMAKTHMKMKTFIPTFAIFVCCLVCCLVLSCMSCLAVSCLVLNCVWSCILSCLVSYSVCSSLFNILSHFTIDATSFQIQEWLYKAKVTLCVCSSLRRNDDEAHLSTNTAF
jgi:hypothetical protein